MRHAHLPKVDRTRAQMQLGVSEQSQLEHRAARLVYLHIHHQKDVPDSFHYIGQSWLFMYRTKIYSQEECTDFLRRHPGENLLMTSHGIVDVNLDDPDRHLAWIKNENRDTYRKQIEEKKKQSERAKAQQEAKRKAEEATAFGHSSKRGTVSSVAQPSQQASTSTGTSSSQGQPSSSGRVETAEIAWAMVPESHQARTCRMGSLVVCIKVPNCFKPPKVFCSVWC